MTLPAYYRAPDNRCLFRLHASAALVDTSGRLLLVREAKQDSRGKWNLPGGHVDHGEFIADAARRETREETGLEVTFSGLVGVYSGPVSARFVFRAESMAGNARAGDEILDVRWAEIEQLLQTSDDELVSPATLKRVAQDLKRGRVFPIDLITPYQKS
jgi:ADP-ribose pyrophosphatase YjhB (NUDIX family)